MIYQLVPETINLFAINIEGVEIVDILDKRGVSEHVDDPEKIVSVVRDPRNEGYF